MMERPRASIGTYTTAPDREDSQPAAREGERTVERMIGWLDARAHVEESHGRPAIASRLREIKQRCAPSPSVVTVGGAVSSGKEVAYRLGEGIHEALRQATNVAYGSGSHSERTVSLRLKKLAEEFYREFLSEWARP